MEYGYTCGWLWVVCAVWNIDFARNNFSCAGMAFNCTGHSCAQLVAGSAWLVFSCEQQSFNCVCCGLCRVVLGRAGKRRGSSFGGLKGIGGL